MINTTSVEICTPPPVGVANSIPFSLNSPRGIKILANKGNTSIFSAATRLKSNREFNTGTVSKKKFSVLKTENAYIKLDQELSWKQDAANQMMIFFQKNIDKEIANQFYQNHENGSNYQYPRILALLKEFLSQEKHTDLRTFVMEEYSMGIIQVTKDFFREFIVDQRGSDPVIDTYIEEVLKQGYTLEQAAYWTKGLSDVVLLTECFNLSCSSWHPEQSLMALIEEIKKHGPLLVKGKFGKPFYMQEPSQLLEKAHTLVLNRLEERSLWGWQSNADRKDRINPHSIIIVGAREDMVGDKKIERVYFIDPADPSDPEHPELQKIYVMSFQKLKEGLCDLTGRQFRHETTGEVVFTTPSKNGEKNFYAVHGDKVYS